MQTEYKLPVYIIIFNSLAKYLCYVKYLKMQNKHFQSATLGKSCFWGGAAEAEPHRKEQLIKAAPSASEQPPAAP